MTISDVHFGAEVLTRKGKSYVFDDIECMRQFLHEGALEKQEIRDIYMVDYSVHGKLVSVKDCFLIRGEAVRSPMGGNTAAFSNEDSMKKFKSVLQAADAVWTDPFKPEK